MEKWVSVTWTCPKTGATGLATVPYKALDRFILLYCKLCQRGRDVENSRRSAFPCHYEKSLWYKDGVVNVKPTRKLKKLKTR